MITKATGIVMSSVTVAVRMKRKMSMLLRTISASSSTTAGMRPSCQPATSSTVMTTSSRNSGRMILPARLRRFHGREITLTAHAPPRPAAVLRAKRPRPGIPPGCGRCLRSLVHAAHDRIEAGHDGHRIGDQVARHQMADSLEREVRRVVDAQPEGLIGAVAHGVAGVLAARALDGDERPAGRDADHARDL